MNTDTHSAQHHLASEIQKVTLGDKRLNKRCALLLDSLGKSFGQSICAANPTWSRLIAAYRFLANSKVESSKMLSPHLNQSLRRAKDHTSIRVVQDTSEADFSTLTSLHGAGPLSTLQRRGMFIHASMLLAEGGLPLGISKLQFLVRKDEDHGKNKKQLPIEDKESHRWLEGYCHACEIAGQLPATEVFSVADREADIFEIFVEAEERRDRGDPAATFVIRAKENRVLTGQHKGLKLFDLAKRGRALGSIEFDMPDAKQRIKEKGNTQVYHRKKRRVKQEVRVEKITPRVPSRKGRKLPEVTLWLISAVETSPPDGQRPILWRILTNKPVEDFETARKIIHIYVERWHIEVFFRTLKTGCSIEKLRLKTIESLQRAITLLSIVAWRQLYLTHLARENPEASCEVVFEPHEWQAAIQVITKKPFLKEPPKLGYFLTEVAKLGGYLNRKSDPPPGAEVVWRGLIKIEAYAEAWLAFKTMN